MKTSSAKAKGRNLQQWTRDLLLKLFPSLEQDDIKSTSMGVSGLDIQLSPAARKKIPLAIECKSRAKIGVYSFYDQAVANSGTLQPIVVIKQNRREPLVLVDAEYFFKLIQEQNGRN